MEEKQNKIKSDINKVKKKSPFFKYLFIFIDGVILGLVSIGIPGFSASTIAVVLGIYFLMVEAMANIFKEFKKSILFLVFLYLGYGVGSALAAMGVNILFENYPLATVIAVIGVILGSVPDTLYALKGNLKKISGYIVFLIVAGGILCYNFFATEGDTVTFPENPDILFLLRMTLIGLVTSCTFVIPGVDFAIVFMSLGLYYPFSNMLAKIFMFTSQTYFSDLLITAKILLFYMAGYFVGVFLLSKLVKFLTKKYKPQTSFANAAFVLVAPIIVVKNCIFDNHTLDNHRDSFKSLFIDYSIPQLIVGIILGILGFIIIFYIAYHHRKNEEERIDNMLKAVDTNIDELIIKKKYERAHLNEIDNSNGEIDLNNIEIAESIYLDKNKEEET